MNVITGGEVPVATFGPFSMAHPALFVQHAGYYYYMSACCAEERWVKFKALDSVSVTVFFHRAM